MSLVDQPRVTSFVTHDQSFGDVLGADPRLLKLTDVDAHEGPVYLAGEDALYFTTLPVTDADGSPLVSIKRLALDGLRIRGLTTVRENANGANGMTLGADGRLLVCEQGTRVDHARISSVDPATGDAETVVDAVAGAVFNSPNDIVRASDGSVWFTDPSYGYLQGFKPAPAQGDFVYRHDPGNGSTTVVASDFDKPNGLAFSPDETILYVGDSGANHEPGSYDPRRPHHIRAFDVTGGRLRNSRLFADVTPGFPDGLKVDGAGRVYASALGGVQVFDPAGLLIGEIDLPGAVNFVFGGRGRNVLFITTDTAAWAAVLNAKGA